MSKRYYASVMKEKMHDFIKRHGNIVSSIALASTFLRISCDDEETSHKILKTVFKGDKRFKYLEGAGWTIFEESSEHALLSKRIFIVLAGNIAEAGALRGRICEATLLRIEKGKESGAFHRSLPDPGSGGHLGITIKDAHDILKFIGNEAIVYFEPASLYRQFVIEIANKTGSMPQNESLSLRDLMRNLFSMKKTAGIEDAARILGLPVFSGNSAQVKVRAATEIFLALLDNLMESGIESFDQLKSLEKRKGDSIDFSSFDFDASFLESIPEKPGVYRFLDAHGAPLYIGKARNLRRRISSYFLSFRTRPPKIESLYKSLRKIAYEETGSELEAILKESSLIRSLRPPINRQFEVHERKTGYSRQGDLIIFLPAPSRGQAVLYFVQGGRPIARFQIHGERKEYAELRRFVQSYYFRSKRAQLRKDHTKPRKRGIRLLNMELIASYMRKNRDSVSWFDPTEYRTPADVIRVIRSSLRALPDEKGRTIRR